MLQKIIQIFQNKCGDNMLKIRITYNYERPEELEEAYKNRGKSKYSSIYLDVEIKK